MQTTSSEITLEQKRRFMLFRDGEPTTEQQAKDVRAQLLIDINTIQAQLEMNDEASPEWARRARAAQHIKKAQLARIEQILDGFKAERQAAHQQALIDSAFRKIAERDLEPEDYREMLVEARQDAEEQAVRERRPVAA